MPEEGMAGSAFDGAALELLLSIGGVEMVDELYAILTGQFPQYLAAARAGAEAGDAEAVRQATHAVKSSSGQLGGSLVQQLCGKAEADAAEGNLATMVQQLDAIEVAYNDLVTWLGGELAKRK